VLIKSEEYLETKRLDEVETKIADPYNSLFGWLVADGWCWFVLREEYCWLVADGWFVVREKYCWLVADKPSEHGVTLLECVVLWLVQYSCRNSFHTYARVFCEIVRRWRWGTSAIIYQHILPHCCHRGGQASWPFPRLQCWHDCNAGLPERPSLTDEACALAE
jgi:hypothetical protein